MDRELQKWYEGQFELFGTQGWKDFVEKAAEMFDAYDSVEAVQNAEQLHRIKGILEILRWITSWQEAVENNHKVLSDE